MTALAKDRGAEYLDKIAASGEGEVIRLANLSPIDYDRERIEAAKQLGVRPSTLDAEVKQKREQGKSQDKPALFTEVDPWPSPVHGAELLADLADSARRFLTLPQHGDTTLALWVLFSHVIDAADTSPILAITAPEKRCGKTTALQWLSRLVARPLPASNMTAAVVFRAVEKWEPTLLIDEADTFIRNSDELRGVLNSGHSRQTAFVIRTVGDDYEPQQFSTWSAKAIAMIGHLPDTLADRSINIEMRRKLPHEHIEKMRDAGGHFEKLQRKCARFAADNIEAIEKARPEMPPSLNDRAADNWQTLFTIADAAGDDWPSKTRAAAVALSGIEQESDSINAELLRDIKEAFERRKVERMRTAELIEALCEDEESPWPTWNRGKPITSRQLSKRLREFSITGNQTIRFGKRTGKGYRLEQFADAFRRYLPPESVTPSQGNNGAASSPNAISNTPAYVTDTESLKSPQGAGCDDVTGKPWEAEL